MSSDEIYFWWFVWLAIGGIIVVAAAALLITIILVARRIVKLAGVALGVVAEIEQNTKPIWEINTTNKVAGDLLAGAKAIEANAGAIVGALSAADKNRAA